MTAINPSFQGLPSEEWSRLEGGVKDFEEAHQRGEHPAIADYLPTERAGCLPLLVELVHVDLECRLKTGEAVRVESYLERYPELARDRPVVLGLLAAEFALRSRREPERLFDDYARRFPQYREELLAHLLASSQLSGPLLAALETHATRPQASSLAAGDNSQRPDYPESVPQQAGSDRSPPAAASGLPAVAGHEILGVLGRGGMGIVYQARQVQLQRLVALKMILAGDHVRPEQLERFLVEARAVARLQHPNIVQIYEIGEWGGQPYFSLEYVDGVSLAQKLAGQSLPADRAAALLETLARAIHYSHQRGIVHRDLKPANILLASEGGEPPDGKERSGASRPPLAHCIPKIADFGLAKQLDADSGQTRSGAIVGTPSYMAPEQAAGQVKEIGPATDVYALGAILYEMLTGRVPFKGATVLDTLEQVRSQEPVPPSRVRPTVPHDLETICLKCLAKEPAGRYRSALMLAQDLERFRAGEPILGLRERVAARLWRKVRRNRLVSAALLTVAVALAVAGYFAPKAYEDRQRAALDRRLTAATGDVEAGLHTPELTEAYLQQMETRIADLDQVAPGQAASARKRLHQRFADETRATFRDRLRAEDMPRIESAVALLTARDRSLGNAVNNEYIQRQARWEPSFVLTAPFPQLERALDTVRYRIERRDNDTLLGRLSSSPTTKTGPYVYCRAPGSGNAQLTAVFDRSWATASSLGLYLNSSQGNVYYFSLSVIVPGWVAGAPPATFQDARKSGRNVQIMIGRRQTGSEEAQVVQLVEARQLFAGCPADGSLRLEAKRDGERLTFQVNRRTPLEFHDQFPLNVSTASSFGLNWPEGVKLRSLHGARRASPPLPSALESADDLYNQGDYERALAAYQNASAHATDARVRREARYKEGVCLITLKRDTDAIAILQAVAGEAGYDLAGGARDRWPALADCRLLLLFLRQKTPDGRGRAYTILDRLALRHGDRSGALGALVPYKDSQAIVRDLTPRGPAFLASRPEDLVRDCDRANKVAELFHLNTNPLFAAKIELIRAYAMADREGQALLLSEEMLNNFREYCRPEWGFGKTLFHAHGLLVRRCSGNNASAVRAALQRLDRWLFHTPGVIRGDQLSSAYPLLVERARLHAALKMWDDAEKDLDHFFREQGKTSKRNYTVNAEACLLQGFLRERCGDLEGAQASWRRGLLSYWLNNYPDSPAVEHGGTTALYRLMLGGLTGEITDQDVEEVLSQSLTPYEDAPAEVYGGSQAARFAKLLNLRAAVFREMWRTPRGREWARLIAFSDLSIAEFVRMPVFLCAAETLHQGALPGKLSPEQDELIWNSVQAGYSAYLAGKIKDGHLLAIGSAWKGLNIPGFGWDAVASGLEPSVRGPMAYIAGQRYLRLKKPQEAAQFFRAALADAPPDSSLRRLAQAELNQVIPAP